jgi:glycyl-tRNA synthetase (class II)
VFVFRDEKITIDDKDFTITRQMFIFQTVEKTVQGKYPSLTTHLFDNFNLVEEYIPSVIEPTFGIGRIIYSILEHNFKIRLEDNQRKVKIFLHTLSRVHSPISVFYVTTFNCTL